MRDPLITLRVFRNRSHNAEKTVRWGPFSLARYCMLRLKNEQLFWLSSMGQMVQFDTLKFRRTLYFYFGQFVWIEKKSLV